MATTTSLTPPQMAVPPEASRTRDFLNAVVWMPDWLMRLAMNSSVPISDRTHLWELLSSTTVIFLCYKKPNVWPLQIEAAVFDRLPRLLATALTARKTNMK
ncbi:Uncharacterized protein Fot_11266 [Forsythia ovata]|uniref:Uncharacterized protein n=1 Tax=Forsythia ovata TaxID=205694 RepID=A0ABD1WJ70_9LAMI